MKKLVIMSMATLALAGTASADFVNANGGSAEIQINLEGTVEEICGLTNGSAIDVDFEELSGTSGQLQRTVPFGVVCNSAAGATLGLSSENGGRLLRDGTETGDGNEIAYTVNPDPGSDAFSTTPGTPPTSLANDKSYSIAPGAALREGRAFDMSVYFNGVKGPDFNGAPTTTVFAGNYSDTITVSLSAN